ncbi:MAG: hypothetical protein HZA66_19300 [Rhodopseudomonas palustris]|uniref:Uncharacterized protein n=1 Tax=Rhodopseudomonas palustris TaxID=1076 RepID=A0A933RZI9_RHOPL|nr:hypothetical protein [Rhodopseudomonas palustris]
MAADLVDDGCSSLTMASNFRQILENVFSAAMDFRIRSTRTGRSSMPLEIQ